MKRIFRNFRFAMFGVSLLCIALGLAILLWPEYAKKVMCYGFGAVLVLSGILQVASYLTGERVGLLRKLLLISGIVSAVIGVWVLLSQPDKILTLTVIVMGIVLIYHGAMDIKYGFDIKACGTRGWAPALVFGLITCGAGVLVLVNPFEASEMLFMAAGIGFLFDGLTDLFAVFAVAHAKATYEKLSGAAPVIELEPGAASQLPLDGNGAHTPAISEPEETDVADPVSDTADEPAEAADASEEIADAAAVGEGGEGGAGE